MKKNAFLALSGVVLLVALSACGKTTKGKIANEWKITSSEEQSDSESSTGKDSRTITITGTTYNSIQVHQPVGGPSETITETGTVNVNDFTINKDGTWMSVREISKPQGSGSNTSRGEESGTWSFLEKTKGDDFKKNERVLFNVLASKYYSVTKQNGAIIAESTSNTTYLTGERSHVYTITGSKKKKLEMEAEQEGKIMSGTESTYTGLQKLVLEEK